MTHSVEATKFLRNEERVDWHDENLWQARQKRDVASKEVPEWEELRQLASDIKDNVLSHLGEYLLEFEKNAANNGINVHWAIDGKEHNEIVHSIIKRSGYKNIVKSKSILTEECGLNGFLKHKGYEVVDTDLGERIIQLDNQPPSHIVMPAIHLRKKEIGDIFHKHLGTEKGIEDAQFLTEVARQHLREKFLQVEVAITGVNFGVADTGGFVVVTNEGNADMGCHLSKIHIACMGIEKLIPKAEHLGVFTRLLARSAIGQLISIYTSHYIKPRPGQEMHIVLVDNGRTEQLKRDKFRNSLKCIRCGACMNTCPIYRRSGGYSYNATVPGPIGSILSPGLDLKKYSSLPFASTLCGSCSDVCPVKINIHEQLYEWRQEIIKSQTGFNMKNLQMSIAGSILKRPRLYRLAGGFARFVMASMPRFITYNGFNKWGKHRELPEAPNESFNQWYRNRKK